MVFKPIFFIYVDMIYCDLYIIKVVLVIDSNELKMICYSNHNKLCQQL